MVSSERGDQSPKWFNFEVCVVSCTPGSPGPRPGERNAKSSPGSGMAPDGRSDQTSERKQLLGTGRCFCHQQSSSLYREGHSGKPSYPRGGEGTPLKILLREVQGRPGSGTLVPRHEWPCPGCPHILPLLGAAWQGLI